MAQKSKKMHLSSPNKRLKRAIEGLEANIKDICEKTGIPKRTLYNLFEEGATIKSDYLIELNKIYGIDPTEILVGSADCGTLFKEADSNKPKDHDQFYTIPFHASIKASAGGGLIPREREPLAIAFRKYFVNKSLKTQAKNLFAMKIAGDSMSPTILNEDIILVNRARRTPRAGKILVIRIDDTLSCKRIQELPGNRFRIMSDNEAYESFEVSSEEKGFEIIGTVIWFGRSL